MMKNLLKFQMGWFVKMEIMEIKEDNIFWRLYERGPAIALELGLKIGIFGFVFAAVLAVPAIIETVDGWEAIHD